MLAEYNYKQKYEQVFHQCSNGLIFIDKEGVILDANHTVEKIFKVDRETLFTLNIQHFFATAKNQSVWKTTFEELIQTGQAEVFTELTVMDGEKKHVHLILSKQPDADMYLIELFDDTEKVSIRKRLEHSEALSTVGHLAASIAHEIRNPITSLKGFTQLLLKTADGDGKRYLDVIEHEINRMEEILTEFLQVSKPIEDKYILFSISSLLVEIIQFMTPQAVMKGIELQYSSQLPKDTQIIGNRKLLKQVFINAIKNSMEAMTDKGKIHIEEFETDVEIGIKIVDEGVGIQEEHLAQIFTPFFTTKISGTGLGLPHMFRVMEAHKGRIDVESKVMKGTTLYFYFPKYF